MHLSEGEIRTYIDPAARDEQMNASQQLHMRQHIESCAQCQALADELQGRAQRTSQRFASLAPQPNQTLLPVQAARLRLAQRISTIQKEKPTMWHKLSRIPRPAWAALTIVAVLAIALTFPSVRAAANNFLGLFRVEQIRIVEFDPDSMQQSSGSASELERILSKNVKVEEKGERHDAAGWAEASAETGLPLRTPAELGEPASLVIQPGMHMTFDVDMQLVKSVLEEMGRTDIQLPDELNGATIEMDIPTAVMAEFGECQHPESATMGDPDDAEDRERMAVETWSNCTTFLQVASPTISAPPGLNLEQIGEAYLQILGMSHKEAASFASNIDWSTTFVIPMPRYGADYKEVQVDGATGVLVRPSPGSSAYTLLWVKDGMVYSMTGTGNDNTALSLANSLQ